ncbi:MAG: hypothetical protein P4L69_05200, partial [Desulfosporosinus sp.]|nr:hypothetical protein [Desulfosporosinus sp.]
MGSAVGWEVAGPPEKGNIVQAVLEELWDASISENSCHKVPHMSLVACAAPIRVVLFSGVIERNDDCTSAVGS